MRTHADGLRKEVADSFIVKLDFFGISWGGKIYVIKRDDEWDNLEVLTFEIIF